MNFKVVRSLCIITGALASSGLHAFSACAAPLKPYHFSFQGVATAEKPFVKAFGKGLYFKVTMDEIAVGVKPSTGEDYPNFAALFTPPYRANNETVLSAGYGLTLLDQVGISPRTVCYLADKTLAKEAQSQLNKVLWPYTDNNPESPEAPIARLAALPHGAITFTITDTTIDGKSASTFSRDSLPEDAKLTSLAFRADIVYPAPEGVCGIDLITKEQQA